MTEEWPAPRLTERAAAELAARREREAAALRVNLRRRKQQRGQSGDHPAIGEATQIDAADGSDRTT